MDVVPEFLALLDDQSSISRVINIRARRHKVGVGFWILYP